MSLFTSELQKQTQIENVTKDLAKIHKAVRSSGTKCCAGGYRMLKQKKPKGYWNKKRCHAVARNYATRAEFARGDKTAYNVAADAGWLDEICVHMPKNAKSSGSVSRGN